jgi:N-acetylglucosamine kinase-like BadF-type ATPase
MTYFLAVDAGGTKTEFLLANEVQELGRVRTGTIKRLRVGEETTAINLGEALQQLEKKSGISMQSVDYCCVGTSGESVPLVAEWLTESFSALVGGKLLLLGDVEIALDACFHGGRGVLVLSGTGSNVAGRTSTGKIFTAGGWGPAMADQGAGHSLGLEGLRRGFLAIDQQRPSQLLDAAREHWKLPTLGALIEYANSDPAPNFSELAPLVANCAAQGDIVAQEVLSSGGEALAYLASLVIERIRVGEGHKPGDSFVLPTIAIAGSVLLQIAPVRIALEHALRSSYPLIEFLESPPEPVSGALWRARQANF